MTLGEIPALRAAVAYEWRTSCKRMRGSSAAAQCLWKEP